MQVANSYVGGDGLKTQYDWLVLFIFMVGTYVFTVGCTLLYVDANNAEYPGATAVWKASGRLGKKPRCQSSHCNPLRLLSIPLYACIYFSAHANCLICKSSSSVLAASPLLMPCLRPYRYNIIGFHPRSYAWWGGLSYMIGAVQYNVASTTGLADNFPHVYATMSAETYKWASTVMYTWGGGFFLIAGLCYVLLDMGLPGLWLGMLRLYTPTLSKKRS